MNCVNCVSSRSLQIVRLRSKTPPLTGERSQDRSYLILKHIIVKIFHLLRFCMKQSMIYCRDMAVQYEPRKIHTVENVLRLSGLEPLTYEPKEGDMRSTFLNLGERCNVAGSAMYKKAIVDGEYDKAAAIATKQVFIHSYYSSNCMAIIRSRKSCLTCCFLEDQYSLPHPATLLPFSLRSFIFLLNFLQHDGNIVGEVHLKLI